MREPQFTPLAFEILKDRYLMRDEYDKIIETPAEMLWRVASFVANAEPKESDKKIFRERFYDMMARLDFLPNSPTLMNAGRQKPYAQLSACFVIDIEDSMESICEALRKQMLIHKSGGGTGFNFSKLRPEGYIVHSSNGKASGPVSFMKLFDLSTEVVQQGGARRGANLAVLNAHHLDIMKFINCKRIEGNMTNFNISVGINDDFMYKVIHDHESEEKRILWEIACRAWECGDPAVLFFDTINKANPNPELGRINAVNPCGEAPMLPNEACNLGSINLAHFVIKEGSNRRVDWERLELTVEDAVRFLDDVITVNNYPLPEIAQAVLKTRKIGLGVMGWADMLYELHIPYDSEEAINLADRLMASIEVHALCESSNLAKIKGPAPASHYNSRNTSHTSIAPTGTISMLADCSSGIEPIFSNAYTRKISNHKGEIREVEIVNPYYAELCADNSISDTDLLRIAKTAYQIPWQWHVAHQAAFQTHVDLGVSKTVNLPANATEEDVYNIYITAWQKGCKGITVYRNGSKGSQVLVAEGLPEPKCTTCN